MAKMGAPKKEIGQKEFENLCALQCTQKEICSFFDITDKTLNRWCKDTYGLTYSDVYPQKAEKGKISLRRKQFQIAEHNAAMAIFLGKNYLGQSDRNETIISAGNPAPERLVFDFGGGENKAD